MKKNRIDVFIDKNAITDEGNGVISFKKGLTLSDESVQKNGTRYDIGSMDISQYDGKVFADHNYDLTGLIGRAYGVAKRAKRLVAEGVQFAVNENPLALFVYEMVKNGWVNDVSIGTIGDLNEDKDTGGYVYENSRLVEFSFVGIGNNDNAHINAAAKNAYEYASSEGLDTKELDDFLEDKNINVKENDVKFVTIKNSKDYAVKVTYNNAEGDEVEKELAPGESVDVSEDQKDNVQEQVDASKAPKKVVKKQSSEDVSAMIQNAIDEATKPLVDELTSVKKQAKDLFDKSAEEPQFVMNKSTSTRVPKSDFEAQLKSMSYQEITGMQVQKFWEGHKQGDQEAKNVLRKINEFNLDGLKEAGIAKNVLTISDFGNFVTNPELVTEIQGYRTDFSELLRAFNYAETNALRMAWVTRNGDISMSSVEFCDDDANGNLKPISEYDLTPHTKDLEELAAVTPVCNAATIFLAVDLIQDVTAGYRNDYDRKLAQGIIGELERAIEGDATRSVIGVDGTYDTAPEQLEQIRVAIFSLSQGNGVLVMSEATYGYIWHLLTSTGNGAALTQLVQNGMTTNMLWSKQFVIAPNELMPTLGGSTTPTWELDGTNVTVNHAIYYVNPTNFRGRQNGGLRFDLSTEAAYEVGGTVFSAYQRNEVVLRGSMFRGTAILDPTRVRAVRALAVIS